MKLTEFRVFLFKFQIREKKPWSKKERNKIRKNSNQNQIICMHNGNKSKSLKSESTSRKNVIPLKTRAEIQSKFAAITGL